MTIITQLTIIFETVKKFPGQDLEGLSEKIYQLGGDIDAVRFLIHDNLKYNLLLDRIKMIRNIDQKNGRYYFNPQTNGGKMSLKIV